MAIFKRRVRRHLLARFFEFFYPAMGYARAWKYLRHRTLRIKASADAIALGLACGVAVSFTPFIGLHFLLAALFAWMLGGNLFASAVGTALGNPLTFVPIWILIYETGSLLLGRITQDGDIYKLTSSLGSEGALGFFEQLPHLFWPILWPMFLGGLIWAPITGVASYYLTRPIIANYQLARRHRRMKHHKHAGEPDA